MNSDEASPSREQQIRALVVVELYNGEIGSLQNQIDLNNRRSVYILRRVDELVRQVELKNRQARCILFGGVDEDLLQMAEDLAADADHLLLEAAALSVRAASLKKATESMAEQVQQLLLAQSKRNLIMD